jgi:hypothetical protein
VLPGPGPGASPTTSGLGISGQGSKGNIKGGGAGQAAGRGGGGGKGGKRAGGAQGAPEAKSTSHQKFGRPEYVGSFDRKAAHFNWIGLESNTVVIRKTASVFVPAVRSGAPPVPLDLPVTTVLAHAFQDNHQLLSVSFEDDCEVTRIDPYAFQNSWIHSLELPPTVLELDDETFHLTPKLNSINISNDNFQVRDEVLYSEQFSKIVFVPRNYKQSLYVVKRVTTIGSYALEGCEDLRAIRLEDSRLLRLGAGAFSGSGIKSFTIPDTVTEIGEGVFQGCRYLESVTFSGDCKLTEIPAFTFASSGLESLIVPRSVKKLCTRSFSNTAALEKVLFEEGSSCVEIESDVFWSSSIEILEIPDSVKKLGRNFFGCDLLSKFILGPNSSFILELPFIPIAESTNVPPPSAQTDKPPIPDAGTDKPPDSSAETETADTPQAETDQSPAIGVGTDKPPISDAGTDQPPDASAGTETADTPQAETDLSPTTGAGTDTADTPGAETDQSPIPGTSTDPAEAETDSGPLSEPATPHLPPPVDPDGSLLMLLTIDRKNLLFVPRSVSELQIPSTVEQICEYACYRARGLKTVNFLKGAGRVRTIGAYAFSHCTFRSIRFRPP